MPRPARAANAPPEMGPRPRAKAARAAAPDRHALDPTRSGPGRAAGVTRPSGGASAAARPGPLHPTRHATTAGPADTSPCPRCALRPHRASIPRIGPPRGRGPGYGGVEDPPMPLYATLACAALTVITFLAVPRRESRLARLRRAQEKWAEQMDRLA